MEAAIARLRFPSLRWRFAGQLIAGVAFLCWLVGLWRFAEAIPHRVADTETATDAIVVLTGGAERLTTGLKLLSENRAERLFISGVNPTVPLDRLLRLTGEQASGVADRVEAGYTALDTVGNAYETARWMRERGYHSIRLVTSGYHMPRSLLAFGRAAPDAVVIPHPVNPTGSTDRTRWSPEDLALIVSEYSKYLLSWCGLSAGPGPQPQA